jgi:hypothetical protein
VRRACPTGAGSVENVDMKAAAVLANGFSANAVDATPAIANRSAGDTVSVKSSMVPLLLTNIHCSTKDWARTCGRKGRQAGEQANRQWSRSVWVCERSDANHTIRQVHDQDDAEHEILLAIFLKTKTEKTRFALSCFVWFKMRNHTSWLFSDNMKVPWATQTRDT